MGMITDRGRCVKRVQYKENPKAPRTNLGDLGSSVLTVVGFAPQSTSGASRSPPTPHFNTTTRGRSCQDPGQDPWEKTRQQSVDGLTAEKMDEQVAREDTSRCAFDHHLQPVATCLCHKVGASGIDVHKGVILEGLLQGLFEEGQERVRSHGRSSSPSSLAR